MATFFRSQVGGGVALPRGWVAGGRFCFGSACEFEHFLSQGCWGVACISWCEGLSVQRMRRGTLVLPLEGAREYLHCLGTETRIEFDQVRVRVLLSHLTPFREAEFWVGNFGLLLLTRLVAFPFRRRRRRPPETTGVSCSAWKKWRG